MNKGPVSTFELTLDMLHFSILLAQVLKVSFPVITDDVWIGMSHAMEPTIVATSQTKSQDPVVSMRKAWSLKIYQCICQYKSTKTVLSFGTSTLYLYKPKVWLLVHVIT